MRICILALLVTVLGTSAANAFTAASGFSATTYATGANPAGIVFVGSTIYAVDPTTGGLYRASGTAPLTFTLVSSLGGAPTGITALGGSLYVTRHATGDVIRIDPTTGTFTSIASIACPNGIAANSAGDLFVTSCDSIYRIQTPATTPSTSLFDAVFPGGGVETYGIAIGSDDSLYVALNSMGQIYRIPSATSTLSRGPVAYVTGARGVAISGSYLFVSASDGSITKAPLPEVGLPNVVALTGGAAGDLDAIGTDGCLYASQGASVVRVGDASGGCDIAHAAPPPPPPSLVLTRTSTTPPLVGSGDQQFTAQLLNATSAGGLSVTFTVTGTNPQSAVNLTAPNGVAGFSYSAANTGTDTITASVVVNGSTITSNSLTLVWPRPVDRAAPTITYSVSGTQGSNFGCPRSGVGQIGVTEYCGWFTTSPTISWTVKANGPSGVDWSRTNCPSFTLVGTSPIGGTPSTCIAYNGDGVSSALEVFLQATATAPTVVASATSNGVTYTPGALTSHDVIVSFACDSAFGAAGVSGCTPPVTVTASTAGVTGTVLDIAGTTRSTTFGPIVIDRQGPVISAVAMAGTNPYVFGTPTRSDVTLTFTCSDVPAGVAHCPDPVTVNTAGTQSVTVSATDILGNVGTATFGPIVIDRTGPTVNVNVTPTPDSGGNVPLSGVVTITASDPSGVASITYAATGVQPIVSTTVPGSTATVTINAIGATTVTFYATDALGNVSASGHVDLHVLSTQNSSLRITSTQFLPSTGAVVTARLVGMDGTTPAVGKSVNFSSGGATVSATTDARGIATATITLAPGVTTLSARFAGDPAYFGSSDSQTVTVFAPTRFVVYAPDASIGAQVQFYGGDWSKQIADKDARKGFEDFKGYSDGAQGALWTARSGDATKPPQSVPEYIGVILTTHASKTKDTISGDVAGMAIIHVTGDGKKAYDGKLGDRGFGTVVGRP